MPDKDYRAILTDREMEILRGEADVSEKYYYRVVTRVRQKIEQLEEDLEVLDENHDTLGDELRDIVCDE
jgi:3-deoxy-D-manno-octulosonate 8-phosphate phosphatase KdsC-like HAD superfamily phosphatase